MADPALLPTPLVVRGPNWLGDAIMSFPAVRNLKRLLGESPLTVATPEKIAAVWKLCPFVDRVLPLSSYKKLFLAGAELRAEKFQSSVLLPNSLRVAAEARIAGIPHILGHPGHWRRGLMTRIFPRPKFSFARQHQQYQWIDLIQSLGGDNDDSLPEVRRPEAGEPVQIGLCPGAEYGPAKRWPAESFITTARELSERHQLPIAIFGAAGDMSIADEIAAALPDSRNLAGQTGLSEFIMELCRCRVVLCNDSGAMHLAAALRIPAVVVFGSTEPRRTGPLGTTTAVLRHHVPCGPCFLRECPLDFACMHGVTPETVVEAAENLLLSPLHHPEPET